MPVAFLVVTDHNILWIADSAAMTHFGMLNLKANNDPIIAANTATRESKMIGTLPGTIYNKYGKDVPAVKFQDVLEVPELGFNLFSTTHALNIGWKLSGDKTQIQIYKGDAVLNFDKDPNKKGFCIWNVLQKKW